MARAERGAPEDGRDAAVVVGAGPNGLAAAVTLARAGLRVAVFEARAEGGGGTRTRELTLPGFLHDVCSSVHPLGVASPCFRAWRLEDRGLEWVNPPLPLAHPFDDGSAAVLARSLDETGASLGGEDARFYVRLLRPFVESLEAVLEGALLPRFRIPRRPLLMARFGRLALASASGLARRWFDSERGRALFLGIAAHAALPTDRTPAGFGIVLAMAAHGSGWPFARSGSRRITEALEADLLAHGGSVTASTTVESLASLPSRTATVLDLTPKQVLALSGTSFPERYRRALARYRYGPGVFKVDWALSGPIPWTAQECRRAGTVHLGASPGEIEAAMHAVWEGRVTEKPFVILSQPTLFDPSRAPAGKHVAWGYCHVPHGSALDMTEAIERQVERFAPGFGELVLARHCMKPADLERHDPNLIGGDIGGGVADLAQLFFRPVRRLDPYATPIPGLFLGSASTPPGGGVHGMCGFNAASSALARMR